MIFISNIYTAFFMTDDLIIYCVFGVVAILCVLAFSLKLERLVQIIVWNYVLWVLCFSLWICFDLMIWPGQDSQILQFLYDAKIWILLLVYWILFFFFVYRRSKIRIDFSSDPLVYKPLYLLFWPLTVISIVITMWTIALWLDAFSLGSLASVSTYTKNIYLQKVILNFPYIIFIYSILSLLVIADLKVKLNVSISKDS